MKAIVKSNWPNAKKGEVVEVSEKVLQLYPNHLARVVDEPVKVVRQKVDSGVKSSSKKQK